MHVYTHNIIIGSTYFIQTCSLFVEVRSKLAGADILTASVGEAAAAEAAVDLRDVIIGLYDDAK